MRQNYRESGGEQAPSKGEVQESEAEVLAPRSDWTATFIYRGSPGSGVAPGSGATSCTAYRHHQFAISNSISLLLQDNPMKLRIHN
jgi:hypothetical protein